MKIVILAFNYGYAGKVVNGPGMCLVNFVDFIKEHIPDVNVKIFTIIPSLDKSISKLSDNRELSSEILQADIIHHWSGLTEPFSKAISFANKLGKKVIVGPNVLDTVNLFGENRYLSKINADIFLTVNERLRFLISKAHNISPDKIRPFLVGPNIKLWTPTSERREGILWKGNSSQFVKDVDFALKIQDELRNKYNFTLLGHPKPYDYFPHIHLAKKSKIQIITSLSETMGLAMMEGWAAGIPSISHPKIYMHGENYKTGIICSKTVEEYVEAIEELMNNNELYTYMSTLCREFMINNFSSRVIVDNYINIVESI